MKNVEIKEAFERQISINLQGFGLPNGINLILSGINWAICWKTVQLNAKD